MANSALTVANTNFNDIKASLKTYLQSQAIFKDFNFEGSNINVLLDVMSYNTFLNNFYLNFDYKHFQYKILFQKSFDNFFSKNYRFF